MLRYFFHDDQRSLDADATRLSSPSPPRHSNILLFYLFYCLSHRLSPCLAPYLSPRLLPHIYAFTSLPHTSSFYDSLRLSFCIPLLVLQTWNSLNWLIVSIPGLRCRAVYCCTTLAGAAVREHQRSCEPTPKHINAHHRENEHAQYQVLLLLLLRLLLLLPLVL